MAKRASRNSCSSLRVAEPTAASPGTPFVSPDIGIETYSHRNLARRCDMAHTQSQPCESEPVQTRNPPHRPFARDGSAPFKEQFSRADAFSDTALQHLHYPCVESSPEHSTWVLTTLAHGYLLHCFLVDGLMKPKQPSSPRDRPRLDHPCAIVAVRC